MQDIALEEFERLVEQALADLPDEFSKLLQNIAIVVEEEPSEDDLELIDDGYEFDEEGDDALDTDDDEPDELLGIYRGIALPDRSFDMPPALPDQIAIFRGPILRIARSRRHAIAEIRDTVIHELGHYFGLDDHEMPY